MKKKHLFLILLIFISFNINAIIDSTSDIKILIELANPKIYQQNDEIYINIKIINMTKKDKLILISKDKKYSFDFQFVTMQNKPLEHSKEYIISFHNAQPVFQNYIAVSPDEGYIFEAKLNDYFDLNISGQFYLKVRYYPELKYNQYNENYIESSNQLAINIRPGKDQQVLIEEKESVEEEKKYFAEKKSPDEIIAYMLDARKNREWEKYFLYLNLEQLILTNNNFKQRYQKADVERQKKDIIREYKEYLKQDKINDISFLPVKFDILKTEYTQGRAKVDVIIYVKYEEFIEKKYYTYFLGKIGNIWYINSYEVLNFSGISK